MSSVKCFVDGVALPRSAILTDIGGTIYSGGRPPVEARSRSLM
jgi:hypothetical protein